MTDGKGGLLRSLWFFGRPIGVAMSGLAGRWPDEEVSDAEVDGMEARLRQSWGLGA